MSVTYERVTQDILDLLDTLRDDWEYSGEITAETGLLSDLGFESLELVVLGVAIQQHYQRNIPFPEFLAKLGEERKPDIYLGDLAAFVHRHVGNAMAGGAR